MSDSQAVVDIAEKYYDSTDADNFYFNIWGGEDIHIGLYESPSQPVREASRLTVERMADQLEGVTADTRILDLGAGYGGAGRYLAKRFGCHVSCLNWSETQNNRNREITEAAGLSNLIDVVHGNFEELPFDPNSFDIIWSQDSFLHSGNRVRVLDEVARVLRSKGFYRAELKKRGFDEIKVIEMTDQLGRHYSRVREELSGRYDEMIRLASKEYVDRMLSGLKAWVDAPEVEYNPPHDQRHKVTFVASLDLDLLTASARWQYNTGRPFTQGYGTDNFLEIRGLRGLPRSERGNNRLLYERPYNARLPAYHRLDVSAERDFNIHSQTTLTVEGGAINAYNRQNLFYLDLLTGERVDQLPIIPYIGLTLSLQ